MDESENHSDSSERRQDADSKKRDRRVIERMGDPELRRFMRFSSRLCQIAVVFSLVYICVLIGAHIRGSNLELNRSIFFGVVFAIVAFATHRLGSAMRSYIENESKQRLIVLAERIFQTFFIYVCTGLLLGIVHMITLF